MDTVFDVFSPTLVLAPHVDDGEFGCGGTISKLIENGINVYYVAFSAAEDSVPDGFPKDILRKEVVDATKLLGLERDNVTVLRYPVRRFLEYRQDILEDMIQIGHTIQPSVVFCPSRHDIHQDHWVIANEAVRAFKHGSIFGYEMPWNNLSVDTTAFVPLDESHVSAKLKALECYMSQKFRSYIEPDFIKSLARVRGAQIGEPYAEIFEVVRLVIR